MPAPAGMIENPAYAEWLKNNQDRMYSDMVGTGVYNPGPRQYIPQTSVNPVPMVGSQPATQAPAVPGTTSQPNPMVQPQAGGSFMQMLQAERAQQANSGAAFDAQSNQVPAGVDPAQWAQFIASRGVTTDYRGLRSNALGPDQINPAGFADWQKRMAANAAVPRATQENYFASIGQRSPWQTAAATSQAQSSATTPGMVMPMQQAPAASPAPMPQPVQGGPAQQVRPQTRLGPEMGMVGGMSAGALGNTPVQPAQQQQPGMVQPKKRPTTFGSI